jgi:elongator complex protein 3
MWAWSIETRPDRITPKEIAWLRYLGVTKVQMGVQSLDDTIQDLNHRGHTNAETLSAAALLRAAGFKIVVHWMPNLYWVPHPNQIAYRFCPAVVG